MYEVTYRRGKVGRIVKADGYGATEFDAAVKFVERGFEVLSVKEKKSRKYSQNGNSKGFLGKNMEMLHDSIQKRQGKRKH